MSVLSVSSSPSHTFSKSPNPYIYLLTSRGVQGDAHCSPNPNPSNLRQVHLIASETLSSLSSKPGALGENITTVNIPLLDLDEGTKLHFGTQDDHAVVRVTGLRYPRKRLGDWPQGVLETAGVKDKKGNVVGYRLGVYAVVERDGWVQPGGLVWVESPGVRRALGNV
jgi:MOSC domain-containing protein YiiM